jgi:nucleotide-binding universal stress UspA family protein
MSETGSERGAGGAQPPRIAHLRSLLAPTDFSDDANHALGYAYALAPEGGTVHLLHVVEELDLPNPLYAHYTPGRRPSPEQRAARQREIEQALQALAPAEAHARGVATKVAVAEDDDPAAAILREAERLGVDAICMGASGRSGISRALAGSVASKVAAGNRCPLLLVRRPREE